MGEYFRYVPNFISAVEAADLRESIHRHTHLFAASRGYWGLGPRYRFITRNQIVQWLPEVTRLGERDIQPAVEAFAGQRLTPPPSERALRIQRFASRRDTFRWHFDTSSYAALLTVENNNGAQTQVISHRLSRIVRPVFYPLYGVSQLFSLLPAERFTTQPGDLLILHGSRLLHRGVALHADGQRIIVAYGFDEIDRRPQWIRERVAHFLNTSSGY